MEDLGQLMAMLDWRTDFYNLHAGTGPAWPVEGFASLSLQRTESDEQALRERNPDVAPHLSFLDTGGHGYAVVVAEPNFLSAEFAAIPRPVERNVQPDGGPLAYRVIHRAQHWSAGEAPNLVGTVVEGGRHRW